MNLSFVKNVYEKLGREDPLYAVLSLKGCRYNRWDIKEFFETGRRHVGEVLQYADRLGLRLGFSRALDFGCGVGRLSQALAERFQEVVGVDIAESMVAKAREFNRHGSRVQYVVHANDDLSCFEDRMFDLVYSVITLQHIPPEAAAAYIREFFRVLRPGGVALFQVPCGRRYRPGSLGAWAYRVRRQHLRRWWKMVRGRPAVEIHAMAREDVEEIILSCGGRLLDAVCWPDPKKPKHGLRYCAAKLDADKSHRLSRRVAA